jgi:hypothetical protein
MWVFHLRCLFFVDELKMGDKVKIQWKALASAKKNEGELDVIGTPSKSSLKKDVGTVMCPVENVTLIN